MGYLDNTGLAYFWSKIKAALNLKQDSLVSGTNIKTINNESLLGSGNINIQGGAAACNVEVVEYGSSTYSDVTTALATGKPLLCYVSWNSIVCPYIGVVNNQYAFSNLGAGESTVSLYVNSSNQWSYATSNLATQSAVNAKQDALVSGTNIKTINNTSLLGSGNIDISGESDVFIAEYGTTTYAEILEAYEAGKAVFCKRVVSSSYQNTKTVTVLPLAYIGSSDNASSLSRKAIFKNMSGNYPLYQTDITSYTLSGVTGTWSAEYIETATNDPGILSINITDGDTYLYSNPVNGIVKDDGTGVLSAAVAGTDYQAPLVSGTNIKTINNTSLLGSGNIDISGGGSSILFVAVTYSNYAYTADKTYAEMYAAIIAGQTVIVKLVDYNTNTFLYLYKYPEYAGDDLFFTGLETGSGSNTAVSMRVTYSDYWTHNTNDLAKLASPSFTGSPTAPTQTAGNNSTRIATTAFVQTAIANADDAEILTYGDTSITYADITTKVSAGKVLFAHYSTSSDDVTLPYVCTTASGNHVFTNMVGNTRWTIYLSSANAWSVSSAALAPLASPGFTGNPTAPTQTAGNNSTRIATTAFVTTAITNAIGSAISASY